LGGVQQQIYINHAYICSKSLHTFSCAPLHIQGDFNVPLDTATLYHRTHLYRSNPWTFTDCEFTLL